MPLGDSASGPYRVFGRKPGGEEGGRELKQYVAQLEKFLQCQLESRTEVQQGPLYRLSATRELRLHLEF